MQVPQFAKYGQLFKSSAPVQLTEEETEYNIVVVKHVFPEHTVLQFQCTNTVQEQVLQDVSIGVDLSEAVRLSRPPLLCKRVPQPSSCICTVGMTCLLSSSCCTSACCAAGTCPQYT